MRRVLGKSLLDPSARQRKGTFPPPVSQCLAGRRMSAVDHPQYSTYIVSSKFRIIVKLKSMLTEDGSSDFEDI